MKKGMLLTLIFCFMALQFARAQSEKDIPAAVKNAFTAKYPNMKVTDWDWEEDKDAYEAEFMMNNRENEAYFSADGTWMKTKTDMKREQLPTAVSKALTSGEYSTWNMSDFAEMDTPEGKRYKVRARKGVDFVYLKYDANGMLLEKKDKKDKGGMKK
ncbi:PepSY-like domain-containing protein [Adhaeribacter sp. BT258]|uniref:PepSY-like domain-containing protein n=1 Tax=Adhaeribacter terrigena TaxID=2793070 RepID=A0ABS1BYW4_9BACT|nr:PepSY-like domain-containing protein [Adhaeribacter terrigena]MBK0402233.1 PepSY-like domain-containing protein [Adhaeribacter terrigena]